MQVDKMLISAATALVLSLTACEKPGLDIVPAPVHAGYGSGSFEFTPETVISVEDEAQAEVAELFAGLFSAPAGFVPEVMVGGNGDIRFATDSTLADESYRMEVRKSGIEVEASGLKGFFYALQTLRLSLPAGIDGLEKLDGSGWKVPAMKIEDSPRFGYRGLMLDVSRYFIPKETVLQIIDCMSMLKLNTLHFHLTDDNGWRIEIKKYPRLASVGAWRVDRGDLPFSYRRNPRPDEPTPVGGYYTQDDIREIVAYAAARQVEVIPEIDMPAHSNAALAAYPQYACPVVDEFIGVLPGLGGDNASIICCAGNDAVFTFLQDILDEVCGLFPSGYIHLGGDEAWKDNWKKCPLCQARMKKEGLKDEEALQGYFMGRMNDYLRSKGKVMMGWDELTNSTVPEDAVVFGWQGLGKAAFKAAEQGHRFVMTPARIMYLIRYQGPQWFEPLTYFGNNTLKDIFDYEPTADAGWKPEFSSLCMGVQGSMWTEFCNSPDDVTYQVFPRLMAVAQLGWSPRESRDWEAFLKGVDNVAAHLDAKGVVYARSMYNIQHKVCPALYGGGNVPGHETVQDGTGAPVKVELECIRPDVDIRYTVDGSDPVFSSDLYSGPFMLTESVTVKAATFFPDGTRAGKVLVLPVGRNLATGKSVVIGKRESAILTNGVRGSLRQSDFEWEKAGKEGMTAVIDLGRTETVSRVMVGCLTDYGMAVHKPGAVSVELSSDGISYTAVGKKEFSRQDIFVEDNFTEDIEFSFPASEARFVRICAKSPGLNPADHLRPGQESYFCIDEISVYSH